jgi:hypothetical protein
VRLGFAPGAGGNHRTITLSFSDRGFAAVCRPGRYMYEFKAQWEKLGGGMARVRKYDSRRQGLEYTLKCLNATNGGANLYEVGKFSHSADEVMLSNSIWDPANLDRVSDTLVTA